MSDYKFLESATNLKAAVKAALDREPNTGLATDAATCLRQGRQFFEAAQAAPLEIRPLLVQYGVIAMGKAITACRTLRPLNRLAQKHGLGDTSDKGAKLGELRVRVDEVGSFQEFSDAVRDLDSITYFGPNSERLRKFIQWPDASALAGKTITFDELFSRLPDQAGLYSKTFGREPNAMTCNFTTSPENQAGEFIVYIKGHDAIDRPNLKAIVGKLRSEYDFLNRWVVVHATCAYGDLHLKFASIDEPIVGDTDEPALLYQEHNRAFRLNALRPQAKVWQDDPPQTCGSLAHLGAAGDQVIRPLQGVQLSTYSVMYMATFMLGSLVRYRPETWVHALAGRVTGERGLDDQAVALVEEFLTFVLSYFPSITVNAITARREDVLGM